MPTSDPALLYTSDLSQIIGTSQYNWSPLKCLACSDAFPLQWTLFLPVLQSKDCTMHTSQWARYAGTSLGNDIISSKLQSTCGPYHTILRFTEGLISYAS